MHLQLPSQTIRFVGYGQPRVANQVFADYIDALPISVTHVNNMEDLVPILPGRFLGFHHTSGEVHIQDSGSWTVCPGEWDTVCILMARTRLANMRLGDAGQDNTSTECTVGDVPNIFEGNADNHDGPYDGVEMGC